MQKILFLGLTGLMSLFFSCRKEILREGKQPEEQVEKLSYDLARLLKQGSSDCHMIEISDKAILCYREYLVDSTEGYIVDSGTCPIVPPGTITYDDEYEVEMKVIWQIKSKECAGAYTACRTVILELKNGAFREFVYQDEKMAQQVAAALGEFCQ